MNKTILKVLVGSRAYGVHEKDSDYDYRGVFVSPTSELLSLKNVHKKAIWTLEEGKDTTMYEIGHFLFLATKCNPTILEVFKAPVMMITPEGQELRKLFDDVWNSEGVYNAFMGYSHNQRKKFLDAKDDRPNKYAIAYTRTLWQLISMCLFGDYSIKLDSEVRTKRIERYRKGDYTIGEVIDYAEHLKKSVKRLLKTSHFENKQTNYDIINRFLLDIRKKYWKEEKC